MNSCVVCQLVCVKPDLHEEIFLFILFGVGTGVERPEGLMGKSLNGKLWINRPQRQDSGCPQTNCLLDSFQLRFWHF